MKISYDFFCKFFYSAPPCKIPPNLFRMVAITTWAPLPKLRPSGKDLDEKKVHQTGYFFLFFSPSHSIIERGRWKIQTD